MDSVLTLIAMARAKCHTDRELADRLDIKPSELHAMKTGRRPASPVHVGKLCDILELSGEEAREWLAVGVIEQAKDPGLAERLRRAFFALLVLGVGTSSLGPNDAAAQTGGTTNATSATLGTRLALPIGNSQSIHCGTCWLALAVRLALLARRALGRSACALGRLRRPPSPA
jgi:hypothetical protein